MYLPWVQEGVDFFILGIRGKEKSPAAFPPPSLTIKIYERETRFSYPMMIGANGLMKNSQVPTHIDDNKKREKI